MATTTPNFNWSVPTSTDLVKDGATAIETLGDSIDASFVDLKGGTTGQVLSKASGTDLDFTWVAQDDSNAIQNAIVDAKGDLIAATAADTPARLGVGTNGQVLTADSTAATGLAWATPTTSGFKGASAYRSTVQSLSNSTLTAMLLDTELFDTDSFHSTATNTSRFTIPAGLGGKYLCIGSIGYATNGTGFRVMNISVNGSVVRWSNQIAANASVTIGTEINSIVSVNATDYIEFFVQQNSGGSLNTASGSTDMFFQIQYLGA